MVNSRQSDRYFSNNLIKILAYRFPAFCFAVWRRQHISLRFLSLCLIFLMSLTILRFRNKRKKKAALMMNQKMVKSVESPFDKTYHQIESV